ncbi:HAD-IA family hydrolase [Thauera butanivorans]|uniref:HAD-IA family hydrolase n=1 Tax=Thauera butanivorans TaxID=86174 RepID=UPI00083801F9|nr:HAD-IA family hydrolase [Thauera butanivorans]
MTSPIRALIFDLDGTLVDTIGGIAKAINCALVRHSLAPLTISEIADRVGEGGTALVEYALKKARREVDSERAAQLQESYFQAYLSAPIHETRVFPGVIPMLEYAKARDLDLAICTNKAGVLAKAVLDGLDLTRYFRFLVYGDSLPHRKPHPGPIEWIVGRLGLPPDACVMIGDTENDVCAARNSGVRSVFVSFGYSRLESLSSQPDWVINDFDRLEPILRNFGHRQSNSCSADRDAILEQRGSCYGSTGSA